MQGVDFLNKCLLFSITASYISVAQNTINAYIGGAIVSAAAAVHLRVVTSGGGGFFLEPTGCGVATEFFDDG